MTSITRPENKALTPASSLWTVFLCILFGANVVAVKLSLTGLGAFTAAGLRFALAVIAITLWAGLSGRSLRLKTGQARQVILVSAFVGIQTAFFYFGVNLTNAASAAIIVNMQPFFLLVLAHFFIPGDRMNARKVAGVLSGLLGVMILFFDDRKSAVGAITGNAIVLTGALIWVFGVVYMKRIISDFEPFHLALYPMILNLPLLWAAGFIWDVPMIDHIDAVVVSSILFQGLVAAAFGFVAWNSLLQKYGAVSLHSYLFVIPLTGVILSGVVLGEEIAAFNTLSALALVVLGIAIVNSKSRWSMNKSPPKGPSSA